MKEYVAQLNITLESHYATTDDGYILHLHRLANPGKEVVFLQHGILASSWCWIANIPNSALGIVLHRNGYDVWMVSYFYSYIIQYAHFTQTLKHNYSDRFHS